MSTNINTGWLKNVDGEKFAPKTLMSQVVTNDGIQLDDKIEADFLSMKQETNTYINQTISDEISKLEIPELDSHIDNINIHITEEERTDWNDAKTHSDSSHAPTDAQANVIETVEVNGVALTPNSKSVNITVPTKLSDLTNDGGFLTSYTETDPTVPAWAKEPTKPSYTFDEVGAEKAGTASSAVSTHNTNAEAHNDIRTLINDITTRLNALANSTDTELDQMAELVEYIKDNRELIEGVTTNKVNVSDIVNNLTTNVSNKPLSAAQGVAIKGLIDALQEEIDEKANASDLTSHTGNTTVHITATERTNWNDAKTHADSTHARTDATKVEASTTNGNIKINGTEVNVYTHPTTSGNKHIPSGGSEGQILKWSSDGTAVWGNESGTTYNNATTSVAGLMSPTDKTKLDATNIAYATCSTSGSTAAKVVTISGNTNWTLTTGSKIIVYFSNTNTAASPTLNVNNTGAKNISYNGSTISSTTNLIYGGISSRCLEYVYNGSYYVFTGMSYSPQHLGFGYATCSTAASTTAKTASLSNYELLAHSIVSVKFTYAVPASATLNINSRGAKSIYHRGTTIKANVINAGDLATFVYSGSYYYLIGIYCY